MPRKARIDAADALHHIIVRGIERRKIFWDDADRDSFVNRLGKVLIETHTDCFAWAMIPSHVHLLMRTGLTPIATVMRRLLTGCAVRFNRRHQHLGAFQTSWHFTTHGQPIGKTGRTNRERKATQGEGMIYVNISIPVPQPFIRNRWAYVT